MSEGLGWLVILGCLALLLMVTYMPWYGWALIAVVILGVVGWLLWRKHEDAFGGGQDEDED